jgi:DNA-binding winged helix-turn-helix (wHTH) protein
MSEHPQTRLWRNRAETLTAENEKLLAEIAALKSQLSTFSLNAEIPEPLRTGPWRLTPRQLTIFKTLWTFQGKFVKREQLWEALERANPIHGERESDKLLDVFITHVRRKLLHSNIPYEIRTQWGFGYGLFPREVPDSETNRIKDAIEREVGQHYTNLNPRQIVGLRNSLLHWVPKLISRRRVFRYDFQSVLNSTAAPNRLESIKRVLSALGFSFTHNKQTNEWEVLDQC